MELAQKAEEVGRILYGWKNQPIKNLQKNARQKPLA